MKTVNPNPDTKKACSQHPASAGARSLSRRQGEEGYTLIALLALMTIMAVLMTAAAPSIRQQAQRSREAEAIWRGEQIAEAIRLFAQAHQGNLPTSMDQLLEGNPVGTKKVQILRPSAARDPLSTSGEWKPVRPNDAALVRFQVAVTVYAGGKTPPTRDPALQRYQVQLGGAALDTGLKDRAAGGEDDSANMSGPFIGVTSRSRRNSIITYYGIERHDQWVFTPLFR
ncbi:MAG TPA: type II secretion system protein [Pyrinomonadaceae bacterium]